MRQRDAVILPAGKLPEPLLRELLAAVPHADPRVLLGPAIGRDAAVIDLGNGRVLVAKSDPVAFASEDVGWYAVHVNANDVVCMGATPSWFLATVLLPDGSDAGLPARVFHQLTRAAAELGVEIIGGHTEVTPAVVHPVIAGTMLGECAREDLVTGAGVEPGDTIMLMGKIAIEGTALLARDAAGHLRRAGVDDATISRARDLLFKPGISIVPMARALREHANPRLMHDPTEGGIATALYEMANAAQARLRIDLAAISALHETTAICSALELDPLGLLSSGTLLAVVPSSEATRVPNGQAIGTVEAGRGVILESDRSPFPRFDRDELARFFDRHG
jgi:hydrogenase maturation factor